MVSHDIIIITIGIIIMISQNNMTFRNYESETIKEKYNSKESRKMISRVLQRGWIIAVTNKEGKNILLNHVTTVESVDKGG